MAIVTLVPAAVCPRSLFGVEDIHLSLPLVDVGRSVDAAIFPVTVHQIVLNYVEECSHLTENENLMFVVEQLLQHAIKESKLATGLDKKVRMSRSNWSAACWVHWLTKEKWVIDILTMVHLVVCLAQSAPTLDPLSNQLITKDPFVDHFTVSSLESGQPTIHNNLFFRRHVQKNIFLDTSKQEGTKDFVKF